MHFVTVVGGTSRDACAQEAKRPLAPVLIYVHSGGYVRGDKRLSKDCPFHDNVMLLTALVCRSCPIGSLFGA